MDRLRKIIRLLINWLLDLLYPEIDDDVFRDHGVTAPFMLGLFLRWIPPGLLPFR